ncbi:hypothetical protein J1N35_039054 [Gossypium stocksii]|uniref:Uncharacterized protein n=1 Tax=Gossypium stocksii TaxID=47602 RepID=A0A9D3UNM2_9ROSI|nr:hypothetical protein J1N35_039054 [Gossypium stocksii]
MEGRRRLSPCFWVEEAPDSVEKVVAEDWSAVRCFRCALKAGEGSCESPTVVVSKLFPFLLLVTLGH